MSAINPRTGIPTALGTTRPVIPTPTGPIIVPNAGVLDVEYSSSPGISAKITVDAAGEVPGHFGRVWCADASITSVIFTGPTQYIRNIEDNEYAGATSVSAVQSPNGDVTITWTDPAAPTAGLPPIRAMLVQRFLGPDAPPSPQSAYRSASWTDVIRVPFGAEVAVDPAPTPSGVILHWYRLVTESTDVAVVGDVTDNGIVVMPATPLEIFGTALEAWWEPRTQGGSEGAVASLTDNAAQGYDAAEDALSSLSATQVVADDGIPEWAFPDPGSAGFIQPFYNFEGAGMEFAIDEAKEIWFVMSQADGATANVLSLDATVDAQGNLFRIQSNNRVRLDLNAVNETVIPSSTPGSDPYQYQSYHWNHDGQVSRCLVNGVDITVDLLVEGGAHHHGLINAFANTGGNGLQGTIRLIVVVRGKATTNQIADMERYADTFRQNKNPNTILGENCLLWLEARRQLEPAGALASLLDYSEEGETVDAIDPGTAALAPAEWVFDGVNDAYLIGSTVNVNSNVAWMLLNATTGSISPIIANAVIFELQVDATDQILINVNAALTVLSATGFTPGKDSVLKLDGRGTNFKLFQDGVDITTADVAVANWSFTVIGGEQAVATRFFTGSWRGLIAAATPSDDQVAAIDAYAAKVVAAT